MAAGDTTIAPLTNSQKLFLQRLLVSHVLTDERARQLYQSIKEGFADVVPSDDDDEDEGGGRSGIDQGYMGNNLEHCLGIINASLVPAFNLEICTVSLPPPYDPDREHDGGGETPSLLSQGSTGSGRGRKKRAQQQLVRYHAVVNRSNDTVARSHAFPLSRGGPHDMAYFRLVFEKIVERGVETLEEGGGGGGAGAVGCPGAMSRMELINLFNDMEDVHKGKMSISQTERALELLENEGWLAQVAPPTEDDSDDEQEENDEDDDEGGEKPKKKRKRRPASRGSVSGSGGSRRKSLKGTFYGIGPRSFMELGEFLQNAGMPGDRMPQSILHRV